jgi:hypothetical protein
MRSVYPNHFTAQLDKQLKLGADPFNQSYFAKAK